MQHDNATSSPKSSDSKTQKQAPAEQVSPVEQASPLAPHLRRSLASSSGDDNPDSVRDQYASQLSQLPQTQRVQMMRHLQQSYGNRQTASIMRQVPSSDQDTESHPWTPPFELAVANTKDQAANRLGQIELKLLQLSQNYDLEEDAQDITDDIRAVRTLRGEFSGDTGPIDTSALTRLNLMMLSLPARYDAKISGMKARVAAGLRQISSAPAPDMSVTRDAIAEKLRIAFRENADETFITELKSADEKIKEYVDAATKYSEWAQKAAGKASMAKAEKFLEQFGKQSKSIGEGLEKINQVLTVAKAIESLAVERGFSPQMNAIGRLEDAIAAIDVVVSFAKFVPVFGDIWSKWYKPLTEACIRGLKIVAREDEKLARDLEFFDWLQQAPRNGYGAPIISNKAEFFNLFPGGQPVLNFMWVIMDGGSPPVSQAVISFFVSVAERMSIAERYKLKTESTSDWYNPFSWLNEDTIDETYLITWVSNRKNMIWAMLYGSMKHGGIA